MSRILPITLLLFLSLLAARGAHAQLTREKPTLIKATDRVYYT